MSEAGSGSSRPVESELYPWYDSVWLTRYTRAKEIIAQVRPEALDGFVHAFDVFHTRPDFAALLLQRPFDDIALAELRRIVKGLRPTDLEIHEAKRMGRFIVHDHPYLTALNKRTAPLVSELVGEPVEAAYTFLSLYTARGVCAVHMDSPHSKWTLDLCLDQSVHWPIHLSQVVPWPDPTAGSWGENWEESIKRSPEHRFTTHVLERGQALLFSGSSQWHYRDPMPRVDGLAFCNLAFLHYVPAGTGDLVHHRSWAEIFGIPELSAVE